MPDIYLKELTISELKELIREVIKEEISKIIIPEQPSGQEKPINIDRASVLMYQAKQTIYDKCSRGELPYHKKGGKLYFFESELIEHIKAEGIRYVDAKYLAKKYGYKNNTVYRKAALMEWPSYKIGGKLRFIESEIESLILKQLTKEEIINELVSKNRSV